MAPSTTTTATSDMEQQQPKPLESFFANLMVGNAILSSNNIVIVDDNAKQPAPSMTKSRPRRRKKRVEGYDEDEDDRIEPDERFSFLPSRWEATPERKMPNKPGLPQRKVSIELPFGRNDEDSDTELSWSFSDSGSSSSTDGFGMMAPPFAARWASCKLQQTLPKCPVRSPHSSGLVKSDSYSSLSSSSSHSRTLRSSGRRT